MVEGTRSLGDQYRAVNKLATGCRPLLEIHPLEIRFHHSYFSVRGYILWYAIVDSLQLEILKVRWGQWLKDR